MIEKTCPFCGGDRVIVMPAEQYERFCVRCMDCGARGPVKSAFEAAWYAFNKRVVFEPETAGV